MAEVHRLPERRREFIADGVRSALRATWHNEAGYVVVSLWHGDTCVATSHLTPSEAGRLASFITVGLAEMAHDGVTAAPTVARVSPRSSWRARLRSGVRSWRDNVAWSLERIAHKLRSTR